MKEKVVLPFSLCWQENSRQKVKQLIVKFFSFMGVIYTSSGIEHLLFGNESNFIPDFAKKNCLFVILACFSLSVLSFYKKPRYSQQISNTDITVTIEIMDIFKKRDSTIVIPINSEFKTTMEDHFVDKRSVQGQFQNKYYQNNLKGLNQALKKYLVQNGCKTEKGNRYALGTVSRVTHGEQYAYFLTVIDVDDQGDAKNITIEKNVRIPLCSLWEKIGCPNIPVAIPVITTGRGGYVRVEDVIRETISTFVAVSRASKGGQIPTKKLTICIHPMTFKELNVKWERLCDCLRYECGYEKRGSSSTELLPSEDVNKHCDGLVQSNNSLEAK